MTDKTKVFWNSVAIDIAYSLLSLGATLIMNWVFKNITGSYASYETLLIVYCIIYHDATEHK